MEVTNKSTVYRLKSTRKISPSKKPRTVTESIALFVQPLGNISDRNGESSSIWYSLKCLLQHGSYHAKQWLIRDGTADQITVVQIPKLNSVMSVTHFWFGFSFRNFASSMKNDIS